jgi:hypothetical protein
MKNLKSKLLLPFLILSSTLVAQDRKPAMEKVESMKIGFLTNRLDLTPDEAKTFWPVYDQYSDELQKLRKDRRENIQDARENFDSMSDAEIGKAVDNEINFRQSELEIVKKYHPQFKKILPIRKVAKLYKAEEDFKRKLLEILQERKDDRQHGQKGQTPQIH